LGHSEVEPEEEEETNIQNSNTAENLTPCDDAVLIQDRVELGMGLGSLVWIAQQGNDRWYFQSVETHSVDYLLSTNGENNRGVIADIADDV